MARILLVEDDELLADLLVEARQANGHVASVVTSGEEAMTAIDVGGPDVVVIDYGLPGVTGLHIVREMRASNHFSRTPVVLMTAKKSNLLRARANAEGATEYLLKPIWPDQLVTAVEALLS